MCVQKTVVGMLGGLSKASLKLRRRFGPSRIVIPLWREIFFGVFHYNT